MTLPINAQYRSIPINTKIALLIPRPINVDLTLTKCVYWRAFQMNSRVLIPCDYRSHWALIQIVKIKPAFRVNEEKKALSYKLPYDKLFQYHISEHKKLFLFLTFASFIDKASLCVGETFC